MRTSATPSPVIRFGLFELDRRSEELRKRGMKIRLQGKPIAILAMLLERPGEIVTREELQKELWSSDTFVDFEQGLNNAVKRLRAALDDNAETPHFIETLPRKGYRFVGAATGAGLIDPTHLVTQENSSAGKPRAFSLAVFGSAALLALAWMGMNVAGWRDQIFAHRPKPNIQAVAVLPLANLSGDIEQDYFADGMTEALITELGKVSGPRVISRQSVMQYKNSKKSLSEIARELNVDAAIEGTVARSGDRVKVTVHLAQASPERQLWAHDYDRSIRDVLSLQDEIARAVADEVQVKLTSQERARWLRPRPVNPEAYADYLRGRSITRDFDTRKEWTDEDSKRAITCFKRAIDEDPDYAQAYAGLADAYISLGNPVIGGPPRQTLTDAKQAAIAALNLDPSLAEAHFSLAQTLQYDWNWREAEKEYKLALSLNPYDAVTRLEYGRFVQAMGRNDEAMTQMRYADQLDPLNMRVKIIEAWVAYAARQYDLALKQFESLGDYGGLLHAYREQGKYAEALTANERWNATHPSQTRDPYALAVDASIYGLQGKKDQAEARIKEMKESARHRYVSGFFFAEAYVGLGQRDQAITWLERAYEAHDQWMVFANSYPGLDRLRSEPRFQALMRRMNFPQ